MLSLEMKQKTVGEETEGEGGCEGDVRMGEGGKVSWHKNFCMTGISLCFKV